MTGLSGVIRMDLDIEGLRMKLDELATKLVQRGVPEGVYCFTPLTMGDQHCIHQDNDGTWIVYYSERGARLELERFDSEEQACEFAYQRIMKYHG